MVRGESCASRFPCPSRRACRWCARSPPGPCRRLRSDAAHHRRERNDAAFLAPVVVFGSQTAKSASQDEAHDPSARVSHDRPSHRHRRCSFTPCASRRSRRHRGGGRRSKPSRLQQEAKPSNPTHAHCGSRRRNFGSDQADLVDEGLRRLAGRLGGVSLARSTPNPSLATAPLVLQQRRAHRRHGLERATISCSCRLKNASGSPLRSYSPRRRHGRTTREAFGPHSAYPLKT